MAFLGYTAVLLKQDYIFLARRSKCLPECFEWSQISWF